MTAMARTDSRRGRPDLLRTGGIFTLFRHRVQDPLQRRRRVVLAVVYCGAVRRNPGMDDLSMFPGSGRSVRSAISALIDDVGINHSSKSRRDLTQDKRQGTG
jgi:hypothetical protein